MGVLLATLRVRFAGLRRCIRIPTPSIDHGTRALHAHFKSSAEIRFATTRHFAISIVVRDRLTDTAPPPTRTHHHRIDRHAASD